MRTRAILLPLFLGLLLPSALRAQSDNEQRGDLLYIETVKVSPADAAAYEAGIAKVVKAAELAELGEGFKWAFMNDMFTYTLVYPFGDFAYWDDRDQWMRQFGDTPGEAMLKEAFGELSDLSTRVVAAEVVEHVKDWSYEPKKSRPDATKAHIDVFWVKSGKGEEFSELTKDVMAFFGEIGYVYPVAGHRVHFGDTDRRVFVIWYDDAAGFYGANSLETLVEKKGAGERWGKLMARMATLIVDADHGDSELKPGMTYWPVSETATR
jgi:hypothetical protein